jgi:tRNA 2-thiouridine synthesizing protein A
MNEPVPKTHSSYGATRLEVSATLVDARGKACPMPIIELAQALRTGNAVELWATDPAAHGDVVAFVEATGHTLRTVDTTDFLKVVVHPRLQR